MKGLFNFNNKIYIIVLGPFLFLAFLLSEGETAPILKLSGDIISVEADQIPLRQLLHKLQNQGVAVHVDPSINPKVSARFIDQPAERVLSSILKSYDYSIVWQKTEAGAAENIQLVELRIFKQGFEFKTVPLESSNNLVIEHNADYPYVRNRLLIRLAPGTQEISLESKLAQFGAYIAESANNLGIIRVWLPDSVSPEEATEILSRAGIIAEAAPDFVYRLADDDIPVITEGSTSQDKHQSDSDSPVVAVLDSGLAEHFGNERFVSSVYDAVAGTAAASDRVGHGTQMSLIAAGELQPIGARVDNHDSPPIVAVRAFDDEGFTSNYTLMNAVEYALDSGAQIISMSWGTEQPNKMLESIVEYASLHEAILVAAAGNEPHGKPVYPAAYDKVIGVGALSPDGSVWSNSNFGKSVSVWAPGFVIIDEENNTENKLYAGTSVATAYLANRIASILKENPDMHVPSLARILESEPVKQSSTADGH